MLRLLTKRITPLYRCLPISKTKQLTTVPSSIAVDIPHAELLQSAQHYIAPFMHDAPKRKGAASTPISQEEMDLCRGSGAYTHSQGYQLVRNSVVQVLQSAPHNIPSATADQLFFADSDVNAVTSVLTLLNTKSKVRPIMVVPTPGRPDIANAGKMLGYQLVTYTFPFKTTAHGDAFWDIAAGYNALARGLRKCNIQKAPRVLYLGSVLHGAGVLAASGGSPSEDDTVLSTALQEVLKQCERLGICILNEVTLGTVSGVTKYCPATVPLFDVYNDGNPYLSEPHPHGAVLRVSNVEQDVRDQLYKLVSINLCPNITGQLWISEALAKPSVLSVKPTSQKTISLATSTLNKLSNVSVQDPDVGTSILVKSRRALTRRTLQLLHTSPNIRMVQGDQLGWSSAAGKHYVSLQFPQHSVDVTPTADDLETLTKVLKVL